MSKNKIEQLREQMKKQKIDEFTIRRNEFNCEITFLEAYYGLRFVGVLKFSKKSVKPRLKLERIPKNRLAIGRKNLQGVGNEQLKEMGFATAVVPEKPSFLEKTQWLVPALKKRQYMERYMDAIARHRMIYYTFVGEQNGEIVAAVDVREATGEELKMLFKRRRQKETQPAAAQAFAQETEK